MSLALWLCAALFVVAGPGCIHVGPPKQRPALSNDPAAGPAACYSECSVLGGCTSRCGYVPQR